MKTFHRTVTLPASNMSCITGFSVWSFFHYFDSSHSLRSCSLGGGVVKGGGEKIKKKKESCVDPVALLSQSAISCGLKKHAE